MFCILRIHFYAIHSEFGFLLTSVCCQAYAEWECIVAQWHPTDVV